MFLLDFFSGVGKVFTAIGKAFVKVFSSKEAQAMLEIVVSKLLPEARPIVEGIRAIVSSPTDATVQDIIRVYTEFGKVIGTISENPTAKANALLNLATELLDEVLPEKYETPLLHSAIEIALGALKSEGK